MHDNSGKCRITEQISLFTNSFKPDKYYFAILTMSDNNISKRMIQSCECYKKMKYLESCYHLESPGESEEIEEVNTLRTSQLIQRERAIRLPDVININDSMFKYPDACNSDLTHLFPEMARVVSGVEDYEYNVLSFWILDVFLEGLRTAQMSGMDHRNQKATLHWMAYIYNVLQDLPQNIWAVTYILGSGSKLTRKDLFLRFKLFLLAPVDESDNEINYSDDSSEIKIYNSSQTELKKLIFPFPPVWQADTELSGDSVPDVSSRTLGLETDHGIVASEKNFRDLETLTEIIYRTYARLWSFFLIRTSIRSTPIVDTIDLPFKLNVPKKVLKYDIATQMKLDKTGKRTISQRSFEDMGSGRELLRNDYILPLQAAQGVEILLKELFSLTSRESVRTDKDKGKQEKKKKR